MLIQLFYFTLFLKWIFNLEAKILKPIEIFGRVCLLERQYQNQTSGSENKIETCRPVVVEMAEFVGQPLHVVGLQRGRVVNDVVMGRSDRSLTHALRHDEEVVPDG